MSHVIRRICAAVIVLLSAASLSMVAAPARAIDNGSFAVLPSGGVQGGQATRTFFVLEAQPGQTIKDSVTVANLTDKPKTFLLYGADAFNTPKDAAFAVGDYREKQQEVGTWIALSQKSVRVPAKTAAQVPVSFKIPDNATPGDHQGAVVAVDMEVAHSQTGGFDIGIQRSLGARVYIRVAGALTPGLDVESVQLEREGATAQIHYVLHNTGNVRLSPSVDVSVSGLFGRTVASFPSSKVDALVPGARTELTVPMDGVPVLDLLTVTVTANDSETGVGDSESTQVLVWRWWLLLIPVLLLAVGFGWWLARRRRARRGLGRHGVARATAPEEATVPVP